ncbi:hypothetical protein MKW98_009244 [Papaver atlanticum]|uniref:cytidine deaminase n=1 Tax=Papaver atlanticum TaxID=357466 RepID=A0AAD4T2Z9_9MAGN|nr:hypothetical protein MKW98_009244 [Papaver atlanticum]
MENKTFIIEAKEAESMAKDLGFETVVQLLPSLVKSAQKLARPPISKFHVGAVGLGSDGRIYFGGNLEFPYLPLHHSVHAEQFLITNANINGEKPVWISHIAVSATPCGHCRQFMQEIRRASDIKIMIMPADYNGIQDSGLCFNPLSSMLSHPFGPPDLLEKDHPLLLEAHNNCLVLVDSVKRNGIHNQNGIQGEDEEVWIQLKNCALEAANKCHAPYSGCPSGVALMDSAGKVYKGSYTESAAYNPSLGPVQSALIAYVSGGSSGGYEKIVAGVLVEKKGAVIRQESTAKLLLEAISPKCDFHVFHCDSSMK